MIVVISNHYGNWYEVHGAFTGQFLTRNAKEIVNRSAEHYLAAIS